MSKIKAVDKYSNIFARHNGCHYHLSRNCGLVKSDPEEYARISFGELQRRHLIPCPACAYDGKILRKTLEGVESSSRNAVSKSVEKTLEN